MEDIRFTAWITTDSSCLTSDYCDVSVLIDRITGYRDDDNGQEVPDWESTGPEVFSAVTATPASGDGKDAIDQAEDLLRDAGWQITSDWEAVPTGFIATVTR